MTTASRTCEVVDPDCTAAVDYGYVPSPPLVRCWGCGCDVCRACSSLVPYRFNGKHRPKRFCFNCQRDRKIGIGVAETSPGSG